MKKTILLALMLIFVFSLKAQLIYDFESPETSTSFQNFGSSLEGVISDPVANPDPTGINTSDNVMASVKPAGSETWAGIFTNPSPTNGVDATMGGEICVDVYFDHIGSISVKLEASSTGGINWLSTKSNQTVGAWETICFPLNALSEEGAGNTAVGHIYGNIAMFFDFGTSPSEDVTTYFDNVVVVPGTNEETSVTLIDWETDQTSVNLVYFGSTLSDTPANIISNPNPNDINNSPNVAEYVKAANSETWAGAFCDPAVMTNASQGLELCLDIHMDHIGNVALKLEGSLNGNQDWISQQPNTLINEWETICFDLNDPSIEGTPTPATGDTYSQIVVFPDFGMNSTEDQIYYLDNFIIYSGESNIEPSNVTFSLDMNNYTESFNGVYVSGSFNDWSGEGYPLSDDDMDGVYTGTYEITNGSYEYKFTLDNWSVQEEFNGTESCITSFDDGNGTIFNNRTILVSQDVTLPTYCFNSCYACGEGVNITFNLGVPSPDAGGVYLVGGAEFGPAGGAYLMTDPDGDNVFSITIQRAPGYEGFYSFANGNCPDYSCKENIAGQDCARPDNFNDRYLDPVNEDTVISTCYGQCTTDTNCGEAAKTMVTFSLDMNQETVNAEGVRIAGQFSNWGDVDMNDDDGDGIYTVTMELNKQSYEYKFKNGPDGWENLEANTSCTITTPDGAFTNRIVMLEEAEDMVEVPTVCFESCSTCNTSTSNLELDNSLLNIYPTLSSDIINIEILATYETGTISVISPNGAMVNQTTVNNNQSVSKLDISKLNTGMYIIVLTTDQFVSSQKIFKN